MNFNKIFNAEKHARSIRIRLPGKEISTPLYFPSVSTVSTRHNIDSLTELIIRSAYPQMLLSAYDVFHRFISKPDLINAINDYSRSGVLLLDSGGFECFWNNDTDWNFKSYEETVKRVNCDLYASFDPTVRIPEKEEDTKHSLLASIFDSAAISRSSQFIPIFHAKKPDILVESVEEFLYKNPYSTQFIAVPERECGVSLSEKARTIHRLRQVIDSTGNEQVLHVLGCGHPLSMALYCYCGADSFDSRDWMRVVVDVNSLALSDFSHLELLQCKCEACIKTSHSLAKVFFHNLRAYLDFMKMITELIKNNQLEQFLQSKVPRDYLKGIV